MTLRVVAGVLSLVLAACTAVGTAGPEPESSPSSEPDETEPTSDSPDTSTPASGSDLTCWTTDPYDRDGGVAFADVTESAGLVDPLSGMHGHAAIWSDIDGNDWPDLYVGTFADRDVEVYRERGAEGPSPDRLLLSDGDAFTVDTSLPEVFSRTSGGVGADLDNDGDPDMVVSRNTDEPEPGQSPTQILENIDGTLRVVSDAGIPENLGARSVGVLDYDRDGLYDLFVTEDRWAGETSVLLRNEGDLRFTDVTADAGIPQGVHGLGVAVADFDDDGLSDIFVSGSNRLFLSDGTSAFVEADSSAFQWEEYGPEDDIAGVSVADVNRDGLLDLAVGHHYNSTVDFGENVPVRLYLNEGGGEFRDVTEEAGLAALPTKAPHVELNDFDNDGWPDLLTSASAADGPALFIHEGLDGGVPTFSTPEGLGDAQYWVAAPTADYDRDGRLDVFLVEWEPSLPSLLLRNETDGGNWLQVSVGANHRSGLGWRVEALDGGTLIGARQITVTQGYSAGVLPVAHFGLGDLDMIDVRLTPPGGDPVLIEDIATNQHIRWPGGCG